MCRVHPYFSLKNLGKNCSVYTAKCGSVEVIPGRRGEGRDPAEEEDPPRADPGQGQRGKKKQDDLTLG